MAHLQARDQQVNGRHAEQRGHAEQREPMLPPGNPRHCAPRHRPQAFVLSRLRGHGQCGH